uniref:Uncharacterized protein n=1 Tax=Helianthus annuus TaxID=4232 RepID=A0A251UE62_HELAN
MYVPSPLMIFSPISIRFTYCNHLRNSSKEASLVAKINISGNYKFDKLLLEIKRCRLRALVLFQRNLNSMVDFLLGDSKKKLRFLWRSSTTCYLALKPKVKGTRGEYFEAVWCNV